MLTYALTGIVSQKLERKLCPKCKQKKKTNDYEKQLFKKVLHRDVEEIYQTEGCEECGTGYSGRIAIHEVLLVNQEIKGTIIYPSAVIGPYDYKVSSIGQVLVDNIHNRIMARMKGGYNFIDVRDLSNAIAYACLNEVGYSYLVTGENMTIDELFLVIKNKLNKKRLPIKLPLWLVMFISNFAPMYYRMRKVKPVFTRFALKTLNTNHNYDNTLAKKELKLNNRPAKESIEDAIDWFINNGY